MIGPEPTSGQLRKAVALGGGHGLHAALTALRLITPQLTAVVTVADDGGSSGRIRRELPVLPPGDLRMALAALGGNTPEAQFWVEALQHRLGGDGVLAGHPIGNLLLTGLLETMTDPVAALARVGALIDAAGRVLPMSPVPLDLVGEVDRFDPDRPDQVRRIRGQSSIAGTPGRVRSVRLLPVGAPACAAAVDAVREADVVVLGPGSWFTSVIPHLLLRELGKALATTPARTVVVMNLVPQPGETDDFSPEEHLRVLLEHADVHGGLRIDAVLADPETVPDLNSFRQFVHGIGSDLVMSPLAADDAPDRHDPHRLAEALRQAAFERAARPHATAARPDPGGDIEAPAPDEREGQERPWR